MWNWDILRRNCLVKVEHGLFVAAHTNFPLIFGIHTPEKNPEKDVIPNWYEFQVGNQQPTGWLSSCP